MPLRLTINCKTDVKQENRNKIMFKDTNSRKIDTIRFKQLKDVMVKLTKIPLNWELITPNLLESSRKVVTLLANSRTSVENQQRVLNLSKEAQVFNLQKLMSKP